MSDEMEIVVSKVILILTGWIINIIVQLLWRCSSYEDNVLEDGLLVEGRSVAMEKTFLIYSYYSISTMITWGTLICWLSNEEQLEIIKNCENLKISKLHWCDKWYPHTHQRELELLLFDNCFVMVVWARRNHGLYSEHWCMCWGQLENATFLDDSNIAEDKFWQGKWLVTTIYFTYPISNLHRFDGFGRMMIGVLRPRLCTW